MFRYIIVSFIGGILFGTMDGIINANPLAVRLLEAYKPIARTSVNAPAGLVIDLIYGFVMAGIFILLFKSLLSETGFIKGIVFGLTVWFFRVVMSAASNWIMFKIPLLTIGYILVTGLAEMLIIGIFFGLTLRHN